MQAQADGAAAASATRTRTSAWLSIVLSKFEGLTAATGAPPSAAVPEEGAAAVALLEALPGVRAWFERSAAALERQLGERIAAMHGAAEALLGRLAAAEAAMGPLREKAAAAEAAAAAADGRVSRTKRLLESAAAEGQSLAARR